MPTPGTFLPANTQTQMTRDKKGNPSLSNATLYPSSRDADNPGSCWCRPTGPGRPAWIPPGRTLLTPRPRRGGRRGTAPHTDNHAHRHTSLVRGTGGRGGFAACFPGRRSEAAPKGEGSRQGFATHRDLTWSGSAAALLQQHNLLSSDWLRFGPSHIHFRVRGASSPRQPGRAPHPLSTWFPQCRRAGGPGGIAESRKSLPHTSVE